MKRWILRSLAGLVAVLLALGLAIALGLVPLAPLLGLAGRVMAPHAVTDGWADLRTEATLDPPPEAFERGRARLLTAARAHGLDAWRGFQTVEVEGVDRWAASGSWWPGEEQTFRTQRLLGTFTSRVVLLDGPEAGQVWGIQSWRPYRLASLDSPPVWSEDEDWPIRFYLPTLQYFDELPFRLLDAEIVVDAGEAQLDGRVYDLVLATWGGLEPQPELDQYVVWIGRDSGLIEKVHYTLRDALLFTDESQHELMKAVAVGTMHYEDYRDVQAVMFPHRHTVTMFGPEQAKVPLAENFMHRLEVSRVRFDSVPREQLIVDGSLPAPGDRKPDPAEPGEAGRASLD